MVVDDDHWNRSCRSLEECGRGVHGDGNREMAIGSGRGRRSGDVVSESGGREAPIVSRVSSCNEARLLHKPSRAAAVGGWRLATTLRIQWRVGSCREYRSPRRFAMAKFQDGPVQFI